MLFQPTNIIPDMKSGIGLGVVDVTLGMKVSWQVNGDYPAMTGMKIDIYLNDESSTQKYTTGKVSFSTPFYGTDALGNLQYYSYTIPAGELSSAGISNGNEYKFIITQYYDDADDTEQSVVQSSASVFITRRNPTFSLSYIPATVTSSSYTFGVNYSQQQGDTLEWVRYRIAQGSDTENPIYDSGSIYGAAVYTCTYKGFRSGYTYSFKATAQTSSGVLLDTGWTTFNVSYSVEEMAGAVTVGVAKDVNGVIVGWNMGTVSGQSRWIVFREQGDSGVLVKVAEVGAGIRSIADYGAASGQGPYDYIVAAADASSAIIGTPMRSQQIRPIFYRWTLLTAEAGDDGTFTVTGQYHFKYNMDSGNFGNNNSPSVLQNFTPNPTVQPAPQNYLSGTLKALVGTVNDGRYADDLTARKALMALSVSDKPLFLKSSKGDVLRIRLGGAVTAAVSEKTESLAQTVTVPWIELEDAAKNGIWAANA